MLSSQSGPQPPELRGRFYGRMKNSQKLIGKKIAILATHGFERVELADPRKALEAAGATTELISPKGGTIKAFEHLTPGGRFQGRSDP